MVGYDATQKELKGAPALSLSLALQQRCNLERIESHLSRAGGELERFDATQKELKDAVSLESRLLIPNDATQKELKAITDFFGKVASAL